jgi:cytochrome c peroxidase
MVTWNARFDEGAKTNFSNFTAEELRGKEIFMGKQTTTTTTNNNNGFFTIEEGACASCHSAPLFNDGVSQLTGQSAYDGGDDLGLIGGNGTRIRGVNIGLDKVSKDKGVNNGAFKIPSLRNIELTGPYMHDGRFKTLEEVVDHYNEKVQPAAGLHRKLKDDNGNPKKLNLTPADKKALIAFLKTLTDKTFVNDSKYSNPFLN